MKILWIDDLRVPPEGLVCDIARTYDAAIEYLTKNDYDVIYLDHDLADFKDGRERTGYTVVQWLVQRSVDGFTTPRQYEMLTSNPVGRKNMIELIDRYLR